MRKLYVRVLAIAAILALTSLGGIAIAGSGRQELKKLDFTSERPGKPTGIVGKVNFSPANADTAPKRIVIKLENGTEKNKGVPRRCRATDQELMAAGTEACPEGSLIGDGEVEETTIGVADLSLFANKDELIVVAELRGSNPPLRAVTRQDAGSDRKTVIKVPEGFVLDRAKIEIFEIKRDGKGLLETPESCPDDGDWTNAARFKYRDGVEQREKRSSPCDEG